MLDCLFSCPHDAVSVTASPSATQASVSQTLPSTVPQKTAGEHNPYNVEYCSSADNKMTVMTSAAGEQHDGGECSERGQ